MKICLIRIAENNNIANELYKKARAGEIEFFTGITDRYEEPENPDIHLKTGRMSVEECVEEVLKFLKIMRF